MHKKKSQKSMLTQYGVPIIVRRLASMSFKRAQNPKSATGEEKEI
jgi:hypothetical protein